MVLRKRLETTTDPMEQEEIMIEIRLEEEVRKLLVFHVWKALGLFHVLYGSLNDL